MTFILFPRSTTIRLLLSYIHNFSSTIIHNVPTYIHKRGKCSKIKYLVKPKFIIFYFSNFPHNQINKKIKLINLWNTFWVINIVIIDIDCYTTIPFPHSTVTQKFFHLQFSNWTANCLFNYNLILIIKSLKNMIDLLETL